MNNYDYPIGADNEAAPWNQEDSKPQEVEVTVSITLSKTIKVKVDDYTAEEEIDEDGEHYTNYNFSECDLETAVKEQVVLPQEAFRFIKDPKIIEDLKDWEVDEIEVIKE